MKELVLSIILVSSLFFLAQSAFAENMFYGYSSFEKLPSTISAASTFELKIRYTEGPYTITKLTPVFDVSPESAKQYMQIKANPIEGLHRNDIARIQSTMTIDPQIPHKKIFVSVYFNGTDSLGNHYKSAWTDSMAVNTEKLESTDITQKCSQTNLGTKYGKPIDLEYDIEGGIVVSNCKVKDTNSVVTKIDAEFDGQLTIIIPKNTIYSLSSTDCAEDSDLMILMDNEEVLPIKSIHNKKDNTITVEFSKGVHTIEFVGFSIMPDPSPAQYCGIVMGFDSLYLPPKFQIERGMKADQIRCNEGLTLLKKASNDNPACVKPETLEKLRERGWTPPLGEIIKQRIGQTSQDLAENPGTQKVFLNGFKDSYELDEPLSFIITIKAGQKCGPIDVTTIDVNTSRSTGNATIEPLCNSKYLIDDLEAGFEMGNGITPFRTDRAGSYKIVITFEGKPLLEKEFVVKESTK